MARLTYHMTPTDWWSASDPNEALGAPSLRDEGFVHCTTGADEMVATANRHYRSDPRDFVVLTVDLDGISSAWRADDERGIYPHVFGPLDRAAIRAVRPMPRDADGAFLAFDDGCAEASAG